MQDRNSDNSHSAMVILAMILFVFGLFAGIGLVAKLSEPGPFGGRRGEISPGALLAGGVVILYHVALAALCAIVGSLDRKLEMVLSRLASTPSRTAPPLPLATGGQKSPVICTTCGERYAIGAYGKFCDKCGTPMPT